MQEIATFGNYRRNPVLRLNLSTMTNTTAAAEALFPFTESRQIDWKRWVRPACLVGVLMLLSLGMNADGGRRAPVTEGETAAKVGLAVAVFAMANVRRTPTPQVARR
jgi:peptidoglycan/LPS O-acetylase OafA/YrhL